MFTLSVLVRQNKLRTIPSQVLSAENQDLDNVRAHCRASKTRPSDEPSPTVAAPAAVNPCDLHTTSVGTRRTLAAGLYMLNDSAHAVSKSDDPCQVPPCDRYEGRLNVNSYDLSAKPTRAGKVVPGWVDCRSKPEVGKMTSSHPRARPPPHSIPSKSEVLARFNDENSVAGAAVDLRQNSVSGKKHVFAGEVHSQQLRGCMLVNA